MNLPTPHPLALVPLLLASSLALVPSTLALAAGTGPGAATYRKLALDDKFYSEGATFGDYNKDGKMDVASGPYWWEGPDFKTRHEYYPALPYDPLSYSNNFLSFSHDFNNDGWTDILVLGWPGVDASWFANPGKAGGFWRRHVVFLGVDNESPTFGDLLGKGQPALVCMHRGQIGYATYEPKDPVRPWTFHPISPKGTWQRYTHGIGFGDVNGDGRNDILEKDGWWEQPASLAGDPEWKLHKFPFAGTVPTARGGSQMFAYDVNGDKLADVITAIDAHGYGISWFEQVRGTDGAISFKPHAITSTKADEKIAGVQFSQPHAMALADFDGDGLLDLLTGKRWWAHGPKGDVDPLGTPVLYAFLLRRGANNTANFVPHLIEDTTGVGTQVTAGDFNGDGKPDVVVGNKKGTAVILSGPAK